MARTTKATIESRISILAKSQRTTKIELRCLSREVVLYVYSTNDIGIVQRVLSVLNRSDKHMAEAYFQEFLGWGFDKDSGLFGSKLKEKVFNNKKAKALAWIKDPFNDIWVWAERNLERPEKKAPDYKASIGRIIHRAMTDQAHGLTEVELVDAILSAKEINLEALLKAVTATVNK